MHALSITENKVSLKQKLAYLYAAFMLCLYGIGNVFATNTAGSAPGSVGGSAAGSAANSLFEKAGNLSDNFVTGLTDLYCNKLFPLLFVANLVFLAFCKDERKVAAGKRVLISICVIFVLIRVVDIVQATLEEITT